MLLKSFRRLILFVMAFFHKAASKSEAEAALQSRITEMEALLRHANKEVEKAESTRDAHHSALLTANQERDKFVKVLSCMRVSLCLALVFVESLLQEFSEFQEKQKTEAEARKSDDSKFGLVTSVVVGLSMAALTAAFFASSDK